MSWKQFFYSGTAAILALTSISSCSKDSVPDIEGTEDTEALLQLEDIASILAEIQPGVSQLREVYDAVSSSASNGYDCEYTMSSLFGSPGGGVGQSATRSDTDRKYDCPLRDMFSEYFTSREARTKVYSGDGKITDAEEYLRYIRESDMQIYWPNFDQWDGKSFPVVTFDPQNDALSNYGYCLGGSGKLEKMTVTEETLSERPVWIVNNNDDASYSTLELLRKNNPEWGQGGVISVGNLSGRTKAGVTEVTDGGVKSLVLKDFTMLRHYDNWFRGASEFLIKMGVLEKFSAISEEQMRNFTPSLTDFMIVVRRNQMGIPQELNTLLVSDWTSQLEDCALMIVEDDGGTRSSWKCNVCVKVNSKSYGIEMDLPYKSRDDIVWRGMLSRNYVESRSDLSARFGDVMLNFSITDK